MISKVSETEEGGYPKEDKCRHCGKHLGWIMSPMGEMVALGLCEKKKCRNKDRKQRVGN